METHARSTLVQGHHLPSTGWDPKNLKPYMLNLKHHLCGLHLDHLHNGGQQTPRYISSPRTFMGSGNMFH